MQAGVSVCAVMVDMSEGEGVFGWLWRMRFGREQRSGQEDDVVMDLLI